jgi:hypothetical protein
VPVLVPAAVTSPAGGADTGAGRAGWRLHASGPISGSIDTDIANLADIDSLAAAA